jgi:hypothetical protein
MEIIIGYKVVKDWKQQRIRVVEKISMRVGVLRAQGSH